MESHKVTSEIHTENNNFSVPSKKSGNTISKFFFKYPQHLRETCKNGLDIDADGDFIIDQKLEGELVIEHSISTTLNLVGLQVWRGAFLLADYILYNPELFQKQTILELGSGVGLTSIIAGMFAKQVICTDVNIGSILKLIQRNVDRNKSHIKSKFCVMELNFLEMDWSESLRAKFDAATIILAADVIYDDQITDAFVKTLIKLLDSRSSKTIYIAMEKRFVFTTSDLDSVAPMYEEFLRCVERYNTNWNIQWLEVDFPQYFKYDRVKELIIMKIENNVRRDID
ncbi:methyltransferase-like protein 22 [Athalia rosae]|uniref:methyltransferase-like protein 22 n=1 Tax=Athalia rosae TaxID=37344 RepID=UPI0020342323|nr:methyltransferase-like protein 22 [Athalia rosae]XP_012268157.2 methyltransferase-like protein 22 [Athalia rosae]XP_012268158.2 methyltransferase-like protein 22 [Athalia rosae]XP_012268163.2 methyltransferase-like protein 22 [Athalia rosae]XP_048513022.1 methyltransferase-like protein 22 [Athalia rosae]XP_048513023.1 methyltransferase-like protein 22 [Athalia rosae]XP_048513024.1 methyltransferase-like protein 22 [Athalia rosae]